MNEYEWVGWYTEQLYEKAVALTCDGSHQAVRDLVSFVRALVNLLPPGQVEDVFRPEMDGTGYFKEETE